jgi:hypothetical protein
MLAKCGHCGGAFTKVVTLEPQGANYKQLAVCCSSCSSILGITEFYNTGVLVKNAEKEISALKAKVDRLQATVDQIHHAMRTR